MELHILNLMPGGMLNCSVCLYFSPSPCMPIVDLHGSWQHLAIQCC